MFCWQCGGDRDEPNHVQRCDGQQGRVEAAAERLDVRGMVRRENPYTSFEAAVCLAPHLSELQGRVMGAFREHGTLSDDSLERRPQFAGYAYSTVRKRRTELVALGLIVPVGDEINSRGRKMLVWALRDECVEVADGVYRHVGLHV